MAELKPEPTDAKFRIHSSSEGFEIRQSSIFDQLADLEVKHVTSRSEWKDDHQEEIDAVEDTKIEPQVNARAQLDNSNTFKVPVGAPPKRTIVPDYRVHPEKWTKYSLGDFDESDASNAKAAEDFISAKTASRWNSNGDYEKECNTVPNTDATDDDVSSTRFTMPEYVVGASKEKINVTIKRKNETTCSQSEKLGKVGPLSFDEKQYAETADVDNSHSMDFGNNTPIADSECSFRSMRKRPRNVRKVDITLQEQ